MIKEKKHFPILDGLRGVAALMVVAFHLFEIHQTSRFDQIINHGYLAVDFFFVLSGFVIGYAYDDRWGKMGIGAFIKRRLVRLQPMVVLGSILGGICFYFGASELFPLIDQTSIWKLLLVVVLGCLLVPIPISMDVRVWGEMFPLNGPAWSLFYEYVANLLYALFVRRFTKFWLAFFVVLSGATLVRWTVFGPGGDVIGGHIFSVDQLTIGMTRLLYPFFAGLLLFRLGKTIRLRGGFGWASLALVAVFVCPRLGGEGQLWANGLFESAAILLVFPAVVLVGAGSEIAGRRSAQLCEFLGKISYPLYIIHYPIVYVYMAYVTERGLVWQQSWPLMAAIWLACIGLAYASLKLYDEPVRAWLQKRFMSR